MRKFDTNGIRLAEYQAKLFEMSADRYDCSTKIFLRRFLHSNLLGVLDKNDSSLISESVSEALDDIEQQFGKSNYGKEKYTSNELFWMGYLYRYISYTRDVRTAILFQLFDAAKLRTMYYPYHTQDMEWCVANLLEVSGLTEDIFDKNWRLKQAMR